MLTGDERATRPDGTLLIDILTTLAWLGALLLIYIVLKFVAQGTFYVWIKGDKQYPRNQRRLSALKQEWRDARNEPNDESAAIPEYKPMPVVVSGANAGERQAAKAAFLAWFPNAIHTLELHHQPTPDKPNA